MQKTKIGIAVGLIFEENVWLKKSAVKAVMIIILFTTLAVAINLIPDLISMVSNIVTVFKGSFEIRPLTYIISAVIIMINITEKIILIGLGAKALKQSTISVPIVDKMIEKYMG